MLIGELSKRSGLSRDTIRFYEKEELIKPRRPDRRATFSNTYKDYPETTVADLLFIQRTKVLGFTLVEIREMLSVRAQGQPSRKWAAKAEAKLRDVDAKIRELREVRALLGEALARCSDACFDAGCAVLDDALAKKNGSGAGPVHGNPNPDQGRCCS